MQNACPVVVGKITGTPDVLRAMYPNFRPRGNYLLISRTEPVRQIGNILIPDTAQKPVGRGVVVAAGPGRRTDSGIRIPCECQIGNTVIFPAHLGGEIVLNGTKYTLIADDLIDAVEEPTIAGAGADPDAMEHG